MASTIRDAVVAKVHYRDKLCGGLLRNKLLAVRRVVATLVTNAHDE